MSGKIYGIGETVYDIIFSEGIITGGCPGGSVLNSIVSLGRLGVPSVFISEFGNDRAGDLISNFLNSNNIDTSLIHRYSDGKTILALAFIKNNKTEYDFYRIEPPESYNFRAPVFNNADIFLFGSFYSIMPSKRNIIKKITEAATQAESIIIYDPNFRKPHLKDLPELKPNIISNIKCADIIRGSDEDFRLIFGAESHEEARRHIDSDKILIYTMGAGGVWLNTPNLTKHYPVRKIMPVSTIGAGDSFNSAIAYCLHKMEIDKNGLQNIDEKDWNCIINAGLEFSRVVCLSGVNYIGLPFADEFNRNFNDFHKLFRRK
jgi:fructokinase